MTVKPNYPARRRIIQNIYKERDRQDLKWGEQNWNDEWYFPILMEEIGETAKAMLENHFKAMYPDKYPDIDVGRIRKELIETAAVALAWLECIDRRVSDAGNKEAA